MQQALSRFRTTLRNHYLRFFRPSVLSYEGAFNFFLLNESPYIILTFTPCGLGHVETMSELLAPRPCHFLVGFWWDMEREGRVDQFQRNWRKIKKRHPNNTIQVLCNARAEQELFEQRTSLPAHLVNHNCFLDERKYQIVEIEKSYDAIYIARLGKYKRFELASKVQNLAIITAPYGSNFKGEYSQKMCQLLDHAEWLNFDEDGNYCRLSLSEVCTQVGRAKTGLMLSGMEGACYASCEYLLCGVPIVSTWSKGGRGEMFTEETAKIVDPDREAVAEGVNYWKKNEYDPNVIRETTLNVIQQHRERFFEVINDIRLDNGVQKDIKDEWSELFVNKMSFFSGPEEFQRLLDRSRFMKAASAQVES